MKNEINNESESKNEVVDCTIMSRKDIDRSDVPRLEIPVSIQQVISKIEQAQLFRARQAISMQLGDIMQSVQWIISRYTVAENIHPGRTITFIEDKKQRINLLQKIAAYANSAEIKEKTLVHILAWLEGWNAILSEMTTIDIDEHYRCIVQMEILPEMFKAIESNMKTLSRISTTLLEEKKKQKKKITSRTTLWKSWKERVIKRPATAHALRPDQMISDEFATNTKVSEIQGMLQELIGTAMFNKLEVSAIKYISSTIVNLSKALSLLNDEVKAINLQNANMYISETSEREADLSLKIIHALSENNEMLQQKLQEAEEKCEQLIRFKVPIASPTSTLGVLSELSSQSSIIISKADKEDSKDSILAKEFENNMDGPPPKGTSTSKIKWDSTVSYAALPEMIPDLTEQHSPLYDHFELQGLEKKSKEIKFLSEAKSKSLTKSKSQHVLADFPSTDTKSQDGKTGTSSIWERLRKVKSEYTTEKSQISSENEEKPTTESVDKENKSDMSSQIEPFRLNQLGNSSEKLKRKGKKHHISSGITTSKEGKTEEKDMSVLIKKFKSHELVRSQSRMTKETSESTRALGSPDGKSEQSNLEEFHEAIMTFLKEKIDNTGKPLDKKTVPKKKLLFKKAEVEKLGIIQAKMEEYFQNVAETVTKILRKYKDIKNARQVEERPMKRKKVASSMAELHFQKPISAKSEISSLLSSESMDPVTHNLTQMILTEIEKEREAPVASLAGRDHREEEEEKQRQQAYLQESQEKRLDTSLKHPLEEERHLWKMNYEISKNLEKEKAWPPMKKGKQEQQKQDQWQEEGWKKQQTQRMQKQTEQDEKRKQMEEEEEQQKQKQQLLEAWRQKMKGQGVPLEKKKVQQVGQVQKKVKHVVLDSSWEKEEEKQTPMRKVEEHESQWQKTIKEQMKIKEENSEELEKILSHASVTLSPKRKKLWKNAAQLHKRKESRVNLKTLRILAEGKHSIPITRPTPTQSSPPGPLSTSGQLPTKSITVTHEEAQALGITPPSQQVQAVGSTPTPQQPKQPQALRTPLTFRQIPKFKIPYKHQKSQALKAFLMQQQDRVLRSTITPEQQQSLKASPTLGQTQAIHIPLTAGQAHNQGVPIIQEQGKAHEVILTPQQAQALGMTLIPQQDQDQGISLTPQQDQAHSITVIPEQASELGSHLTPEQAQALGVTVIPEQAWAQRITLTNKQAQAQAITLSPDQAQAQGIPLTPQQARTQGITLTPKENQTQGGPLTPLQAQALENTITPDVAQALDITFTPEQAQAQGTTLTPEQLKALLVTLTSKISQGLEVTPMHKPVQALRAPLILQQDWTLRAPITPNQGQTSKATVTSEQSRSMQIPITTQQAQISGAPITQAQNEALGVTITPQQREALQDLFPEQAQAQALVFSLTPEKVQICDTHTHEQAQAVDIPLIHEQEQVLGVPLTLNQAQALETSSLTAEQTWKLGVSTTPEMFQEVSNTPLQQNQALGVTLSHGQAQLFGIPFTPNQAQALGLPINAPNAWVSAVTLSPEQTESLGAHLTSDRGHVLGPPITPRPVQPLRTPFTPGQIQPMGITHTSKQDLKPRAPTINEQPSRLWAGLSSGHTLEVGSFSTSDKSIKPSAPHILKQSSILASSPLKPFQESKTSVPSKQFITSRTKKSLASPAPIAEKSSVMEVSSTPLQISRSPLTQVPCIPGKPLGMGLPSDPRKLLAPQTFPSSRRTLVSKGQSTSVQFLAPAGPLTPGKFPIPEVPSILGQPLALDSLLRSRQFLISRDSVTPLSSLISKAPLPPRQPLISGVPSTSSQIPGFWDPLSPGKPLVPGTSSEQPQAFQAPATCEQSPYVQAPSTLGQHLAPSTLLGQAFPLWISATPKHHPTLWTPSSPGKSQKDLSSSLSKKSKERLAIISSLKSKSALVHPSTPSFKVLQDYFTTKKFQISEVSDTSEEIQKLHDSFAMEQLRTFQPDLTKDKTTALQTPYTDEGVLPTLMKPITSLRSFTTQLPKTSQISSSEWDWKSRFPLISKPCILTSVSLTKKSEMMVPPTFPQKLEEQRYFIDVEAQRNNLILLNHSMKTSGLPSELYTTAESLIIETLHTDTVRLGYLFRKYIAYRLIQHTRNNIIKRLLVIQNSGKGFETQNLYIMLSRIDDYQKNVMRVWTEKQKSLEQKRMQCLRNMVSLFSQLQEMHKLNLSQPVPLITNKKQTPLPTKFVQRPFLELLIEENRKSDIFKKFRQEGPMEAIWNADQSTSSYPITEKTSIHSLWTQLGGYPAIPMLLQLDVQSTLRKSLASIQSQVTKTKISLSALMCYVMLGDIAIFGNTEVITTGQKDNTPRIIEREKTVSSVTSNLLEQPCVHLFLDL